MLEDLREPGRVREATEGIQRCEAENEVGVESVTGTEIEKTKTWL